MKVDNDRDIVKTLYDKVISGEYITKEEALSLVDCDYKELKEYANKIREKFCSNNFDMCAIINAKSGKCSEDCKFCAQSHCYNTNITEYPLIAKEKIVNEAIYNASKGVLRFSIVVSGKRLSDSEVDTLVDIIKEIKAKTNISVCASLGLLSHENFLKLKEAGLTRIHNNLETSSSYFKNICTTHTFQDKVNALKAALDEGLEVCSGGIIGLGESMADRIDMAFSLRELNVSSVPINVLNPIKGTPFENNKHLTHEEVIKTCSIFRFILPKSYIRLAGGRKLLKEGGKEAFVSGANATITGDMLTTAGLTIDSDMKTMKELGYSLCK